MRAVDLGLTIEQLQTMRTQVATIYDHFREIIGKSLWSKQDCNFSETAPSETSARSETSAPSKTSARSDVGRLRDQPKNVCRSYLTCSLTCSCELSESFMQIYQFLFRSGLSRKSTQKRFVTFCIRKRKYQSKGYKAVIQSLMNFYGLAIRSNKGDAKRQHGPF